MTTVTLNFTFTPVFSVFKEGAALPMGGGKKGVFKGLLYSYSFLDYSYSLLDRKKI